MIVISLNFRKLQDVRRQGDTMSPSRILKNHRSAY